MTTVARIALAAGALLLAPGAQGAEKDDVFFAKAAGQWVGPGEIIAGKYKGTRFVCNFAGLPDEGKGGLVMDGGCRVGVFTQKMRAAVERSGRGYRGTFQDGAAGSGLDITSGNLVDGEKLVLNIHRAQLNGAMLARLSDPDTMNVTVSVKVEEELVPVIGVNLRRVDAAAVGSISTD
jgi:hypothetical protein